MPDFWLGRQITKRQARIRRGLPDVLDLLVICIEAGLSLDQATARTAEELSQAQPDISDELGFVVLEQRAGRPVPTPGSILPNAPMWTACAIWFPCWFSRNSLAPASPRPCAFTPTPSNPAPSKSGGTGGEDHRQAGLPPGLFIFPSLFLVALGPAAIIITDSFKNLLNR